LIQRWKYLATKGAETAVGSNGTVVPVSDLRAAQARIKELERALGRATMENEILRAARDEVKKRPRWYGASEKRPEDRSR
jgi:transposase